MLLTKTQSRLWSKTDCFIRVYKDFLAVALEYVCLNLTSVKCKYPVLSQETISRYFGCPFYYSDWCTHCIFNLNSCICNITHIMQQILHFWAGIITTIFKHNVVTLLQLAYHLITGTHSWNHEDIVKDVHNCFLQLILQLTSFIYAVRLGYITVNLFQSNYRAWTYKCSILRFSMLYSNPLVSIK